MMITSLKGKLQDGSKPGRDSINVSGTFNFIGESDHTFSSNDVVSLTLGDATTPLVLKVTPDKSGWKFRNGSINARELLASGLDSNINVSARFNKANGSFNISAKNFDFPAAISNQVVIGIAVGTIMRPTMCRRGSREEWRLRGAGSVSFIPLPSVAASGSGKY